MNNEVRNAKIINAHLFIECGVLNGYLALECGGAIKEFGRCVLFSPSYNEDHGGQFIFRILETIETSKWNNLPGQIVRARIEDGLVRAIGHPIKDKWFVPGEELKPKKEQIA